MNWLQILFDADGDLMDLAQELYDYEKRNNYYTAGEFSNMDDEELQSELDSLDSWWYVGDFNGEQLRDVCEAVIELADSDKIARYDGYIQLSDNHTLWDIDYPEDGGTDADGWLWCDIVEDAAAMFKHITGVAVLCLGRSCRHICVEDNFLNAYNYDYLCEIQQELEQSAKEEYVNQLKGDI